MNACIERLPNPSVASKELERVKAAYPPWVMDDAWWIGLCIDECCRSLLAGDYPSIVTDHIAVSLTTDAWVDDTTIGRLQMEGIT